MPDDRSFAVASRRADTATLIKSIFLDVDIKAPPKAGYTDLKEAIDAIASFVAAAHLPVRVLSFYQAEACMFIGSATVLSPSPSGGHSRKVSRLRQCALDFALTMGLPPIPPASFAYRGRSTVRLLASLGLLRS
jgi:hypothetical protein